MIPKPTSAMDAVFKVLPSITRDIGSFSYRTPTQIIGSADISFWLKKATKKELINIFENFQTSQKFPILKISDSPLVSMDYIGEEYSAIIDSRWIDIINSKLIKIVLWYDNEYGYCCNVMQQIKHKFTFISY